MRSPFHSSSTAVGLALVALLSWSRVASAAPEEQQAVAAALFDQGRDLMDAGKYDEACERLAESQKLDPAGGTLMNLAECRNLQGRTSSAFVLYGEALAFARRDRRDDRIEICQTALSQLRPRLAYVKIAVREPNTPGIVVRMNGVVVPALAWESELHVDPGVVVVRAEAPRRTPVEARAVARAAESTAIVVPPLARTIEESPLPASPPRDERSLPDDRAVTAGRAVALVRLDVDGAFRGVVTYVGLGIGVGRFVELGAGALLGASSGFEPGARVFLPLGALRPFVSVGAPVFFATDAAVGVRGSAGLEWSLHRSVALLAQAGAAYFPAPPTDYESAAFVPALGVVGRLP